MGDEPHPGVAYLGSIPCINCGYDLDGRPLDSPCPECGLAARETLISAWLWPGEVRRRVRSGVKLAALASPIGVGVYLGVTVLMLIAELADREILMKMAQHPAYGQAAFTVCAVLMCVGPLLAWRGLRRMESALPATAAPGRHANLGRAAAAYAGAYLLAALVLLVMIFRVNARYEGAQLCVAMAAGVVWSIRNRVAVGQLREVARLCGAPRGVWLARVMRTWAPIKVAAFVVLAVIALADAQGAWGNALNVLAGAVIVPWLFAWPVLLIMVLRALRRIDRAEGVGLLPRVMPLSVPPESPAVPHS